MTIQFKSVSHISSGPPEMNTSTQLTCILNEIGEPASIFQVIPLGVPILLRIDFGGL